MKSVVHDHLRPNPAAEMTIRVSYVMSVHRYAWQKMAFTCVIAESASTVISEPGTVFATSSWLNHSFTVCIDSDHTTPLFACVRELSFVNNEFIYLIKCRPRDGAMPFPVGPFSTKYVFSIKTKNFQLDRVAS